MVQDSPTSSHGGKIEDRLPIEFFPNYLVVKSGDRSGHVYFGERTQQFSWYRRPDSSGVPTGDISAMADRIPSRRASPALPILSAQTL